MKPTSKRTDVADLGQNEPSRGSDLPVELKPGVMGTFIVRMLNGQSPLGRRQAARSFGDQADGATPVAGFGEEEEEDFDEEEEDFEEEDEFGEEEDDDFDDDEEDEDDEESDDEEEEDFEEEGEAEEDVDEEEEEEFDDED